MRPYALGLVLSLVVGFALGRFVDFSPSSLPTTSEAPVGHRHAQPERDLTALDRRPKAAEVGRTVIQARVQAGDPPTPPIPSESSPVAWTTSWQLELPSSPSAPCLRPTLRVATTLRLEDGAVVADSRGWAECNGQPVRIGDADQVDGHETLALPVPRVHPYRAALLWEPPQGGRPKAWSALVSRDMGRVFMAGMVTVQGSQGRQDVRGAVGVGFSFGGH